MLSLDKTKDREELRAFIGAHKTLLSWKLDGLTIVLTYERGELVKPVTRGNGIVGEVITNNARVFQNVPEDSLSGASCAAGEAIITYTDFQRINQEDPCRCPLQKSAESLQWFCAAAEMKSQPEEMCGFMRLHWSARRMWIFRIPERNR